MKEVLRKAINTALTELGIEGVDPAIERPSEMEHGDYASNAALIAAKVAGSPPRELAEQISAKLEGTIPEVERIEIAGPGFINIHLTRAFYARQVGEVLASGDVWGGNEILRGKRIMIEYTQPNPFKVFHIGHLMSNTIGESLSRIIESGGAEVFRANYQGDVGLHIGKTIWALQELGYDPTDIEKVGEAYAYGSAQYDEDAEAKRAIVEITKKVYQEDSGVMDIYTKGREASLAHFDLLYKRLGTTFDALFFESETWKKGKEVVESHIGDVFEESEGAIIYRGERDGLHTRVFINSEGVTTYEAKDIGLAYAKRERWEFDESVTVTAVEQERYFEVIFRALARIDPWFTGKMRHCSHGMMRRTGEKMSSRTGNVISGEDLLNEARDAARVKVDANEMIKKEERDALADAIGVAAIKYMILRQSVGKNITYDLERALSFEGDSGPYLQYTHARACSVLQTARDMGVDPDTDHTPHAPYELERVLFRFPEIVETSVMEHEPHHIATYLTELASAFNAFYAVERIADPEDAYAPYKAALTAAVKQTLKNGLWCMGITAPERM